MKTRKIVLLALDAILFVILICQIIFSAGEKTKNLLLTKEPTEITISTPSEKFSLVKENDSWFVGEKKYPANENYVESVLRTVRSIKLLDKVGVLNSEAESIRYELSDDKKIEVTVKSDSEILRTLTIGKDASNGVQNYVLVDGSKDIYLATGNLRSQFDRNTNYFRSKIVLDLEPNEISSVELTDSNKNVWSISRMGSGDDVVWNSSLKEIEIDSEKAIDWFENLASITTPKWFDDTQAGEKIISAKIIAGFKTITIDIFELPLVEGETQEYWAKCSETPYPFEMASYTVQKFQKTIKDFSK